MNNKVILTLKELIFNSTYDTDAFFEWLNKITCIESYKEIGKEIHLSVISNKITKKNLLEIEALFKRYKCDLEQLNVFTIENNLEKIEGIENFTNTQNFEPAEGKIGKLADGRIALLRSTSEDGRPTLEVYDPSTGERTKIKYARNSDMNYN